MIICGLMETLLTLVSSRNISIEYISFTTRAVRVIDIMSAVDVNVFIACNGLQILVERFTVSFYLFSFLFIT